MVSLSIEAIVAFPQMVQNQKNKSVEGLSLFMIFTWFLGDFLKTIYFVLKVNSKIFIEPALSIYSLRSISTCN